MTETRSHLSLDLAPEVRAALDAGEAVVALEIDDHRAWHALSPERHDSP